MKTLRSRIIVPLLAVLTVILVGGGVLEYRMVEANLVAHLDARLESSAVALSSLLSIEDGQLIMDAEDAELLMRDVYFVLATPEGERLLQSPNLGAVEVPLPAGPPAEAVYGDTDVLPDARAGRLVWLTAAPRVEDADPEEADDDEDIALRGAGSPRVVLGVALERTSVDSALTTLRNAMLLAGVLVALISGLTIAAGVHWGLAPLRRLSRDVGGLGAQTLSARVDARGVPAELQPIHRELNDLLDRIQDSIEREQAFTDAAAHELRTPIAELRSSVEVALRWPDPERTEAALRQALEIGEELSHLVASLLAISRGRTADAPGRLQSFAELVPECVRDSESERTEKSVDLHVALDDEGLRVPPDVGALIVRNLLDNAVRYTADAGSIDIRSETRPTGSAFVIENGPVDLEAAEVDRLFDPFWQRDQARTNRRHVGLGLTIVQRVAKTIGLDVHAELLGDRLRIALSPA